MEFYVYLNDEQQGPYTAEQIQEQVGAGTLSSDDLAWYEGIDDWTAISDIPELAASSSPKPKTQSKLMAAAVASAPKESSEEKKFFLLRSKNQVGPFTVRQIQAGIKAGFVKKSEKACPEDSEDWIPLKKVDGI